MGQKVNPIGLRLGYTEDWRSNWFSHRRLGPCLKEDSDIRRYLMKRFPDSGITRIDIDRLADRIRLRIKASRPGLIIGRKGSEINAVSKDLGEMTGVQVTIDVTEVSTAALDAVYMAQNIADQLKRRGSFRFICKRAVETAMQQGAQGIKIQVSGRLAGAEISRSEKYKDGKIPLHTLTAKIDYAQRTAFTTYGTIGVKVWIYNGDVREAVTAGRRP